MNTTLGPYKVVFEFRVEGTVNGTRKLEEILELADFIRHDLEKVSVGTEKNLSINKVSILLKSFDRLPT